MRTPKIGDIWAYDDVNKLPPADPLLIVEALKPHITWTGLVEHPYVCYNILRDKDEELVFAEYNKSYWRKVG